MYIYYYLHLPFNSIDRGARYTPNILKPSLNNSNSTLTNSTVVVVQW